jgi:hypothetical protein
MAAGQQVIAEQIQAIECDSFQCAGSKGSHCRGAAVFPIRRSTHA